MIHKIPVGQTIVEASKVKPGDTVLFSGIYPVAPYLKNLNEVTVTNEGPASLLSSLKIDNCYVHVTGNRKDPFKITAPQPGASGIAIYSRSTGVTVCYLEIENTAFAGIMCKHDGAKRGGDFVMKNLKFHHNKISKTGGEGLYIGGTNPAGHDLESVEIYDNDIDDSGWDAIQLGNCVSGASIHDNRINRTGLNVKLPKDAPQDNGIQVGDRTRGNVYRNKIKDTRGQGIICMGTGVDIYDNKIHRAGESGIFADSRADTVEAFKFRVNEILVPKMFGIACRDTFNKKLVSVASHNMILNPGMQFFENGNEYLKTGLNNYTDYNILLAEHLMNKP